MGKDLDSLPLAAEVTYSALRPIVHKHHDIEAGGVSLDGIDVDDGSFNSASGDEYNYV